MDTLLVALALLDGRLAPPAQPTITRTEWTLTRSANVKDTQATALQTRVAIAVKTPSIWGE